MPEQRYDWKLSRRLISWTLSSNVSNIFYFILTNEIAAYSKEIKKVVSQSETMSLVINTCIIYWITSDLFNRLMQLTSKIQTPVTFLFVNKNIKFALAFS